VVQGQSAEGLLDKMAGGAGGGADPGQGLADRFVQRRKEAPAAVQFRPRALQLRTANGVTVADMRFNPREVPADGATTSRATVRYSGRVAGGATINWSIEGAAHGSTVDANGVITPGNALPAGKDKETITVKAVDSKEAGAWTTGKLTLWDTKYLQAKKDYPLFLSGGPYKKAYTRGNGKFDAEYRPGARVLQATMKLRFTFLDDLNLAKLDPANQARYKNQGTWTAATKAQYRQKFLSQALAAWDRQYTMRNVREPKSIWGKLGPVQTRLNLVDKNVAPGTEHFEVKWHKHPSIHSVGMAQGGRAQVFGGVTDVHVGDERTLPKFWDAQVRDGEMKRLDRINPGPIEFATDSDAIDPKYDNKLQFYATYLKRIKSPRFNITLTGHASTLDKAAGSQQLSRRRAQAVAQRLRQDGLVGHPVAQRAVGQTGAAAAPAWQKVEVTAALPANWHNQFKTLPHEFGHMLGLGDEYVPSGDLPHYDLVKKAFDQQYADQTSVRGDHPNANIMYVGDQVRPHEYVTFWDALSQATSTAAVPVPPMGHDDWKLNA
jgi:outer membrane protein OmpA-like peptidoglycan-associated protein